MSNKLLTRLPSPANTAYKRIRELNNQLQTLIRTFDENVQKTVVRDVKGFFAGCGKQLNTLHSELEEFKEKASDQSLQLEKDNAIISLKKEVKHFHEAALVLTKTVADQKETIGKLQSELSSAKRENAYLEEKLKVNKKEKKALELALINAKEFTPSASIPKQFSNKEVQVEIICEKSQELKQKLQLEHKANLKLKALMTKLISERTDLEQIFYESVKKAQKVLHKQATTTEATQIMEDFLTNKEVLAKLSKAVFGTTKELNETQFPVVSPQVAYKRDSIAVISTFESRDCPAYHSQLRPRKLPLRRWSIKVKGSPIFRNCY